MFFWGKYLIKVFSFFNKKYNMYKNNTKYLLGTAFENV